jgi:tubulin-folding cofactor B
MIQIVTQSYVNLTILTEVHVYGVEKKFAKDTRIIDLKNKLELISGYMAGDMKLSLLNAKKELVCPMDDDERMLGFYPAEDGYFLQVDASQTVIGGAHPLGESDPNFTRYELTDEEYAQRRNTAKDFLMKNKLGQYAAENKNLAELKERAAKEKRSNELILMGQMKVGSRCQVSIASAPTRLGTVMYLGPLGGDKPANFVGVKYDEPLGKNNGCTPDGTRYFECGDNYGGFVKPESVTCGHFPEEMFDEF